MASINNEQRKNLARIVEQNGTYSDFYEKKYADADKKLVAEHKVAIGKHADAVIATLTAKEEYEKERKALEEKHTAIINKFEKAERTAREALDDTGLSYDTPYRYGRDDDDDSKKRDTIMARWTANKSRFSAEYSKWQKQLIADIWSSDTVEKARAFVTDFLKASGKVVTLED